MHVHYCTRADATLASFRYRCLIPASRMLAWGHDISVAPEVVPADIVVFSKHFNPNDPALVEQARALGSRTVFDVCDDHLDSEQHGGHYRAMIGAVDVVTVNTPEMAQRIASATGREARVVTDPYEMPESPPSFAPHKPPRLLWYGHPSNLDGLNEHWAEFSGCAVQVISQPIPGFHHPIVPWSPQTVAAGLRSCDMVILPVASGDARKQFKSANRMVEAIRAGRFVVASKLPAYEAFAEFMWVGTELRKGIDWALSHPREVLQRIRGAQRQVAFLHSPDNVARAWVEVFVEAKFGVRSKALAGV